MSRLGAVVMIGLACVLWYLKMPSYAILPLGILIAINGQNWSRKP